MSENEHGGRGGGAVAPLPHGPEARRPLILVALALAALGAACAGGPEPEPVAPAEAFEAPAESPPPPPAAARPDPDPTLVLIEPEPEPEDTGPTLVEAAAAERRRREEAGEARIVITDRNLQDYATGELTFSDPAAEKAEKETGEPGSEGDDAGDAGPAEGGSGAEAERGEAYWRQRVRDLRQRWRAAVDAVPVLESQAAELRNRFYAEDDGYYRDSQIKPQWDRALAEIGRTRLEAEAVQRELERTLEEGRRAGALPGWLREGIELEPRPEPEAEPIHEPSEPTVLDEEPGR